MFTYFRKLINKWKFNQGVYIEPMSRDVIIPSNKEEQKMKLYHTETQEDYDALMVELEKEGCLWVAKEKPTEYNCWDIFKKNTVVTKEFNVFLGRTSKGYCKRVYPDVPIEKYKVKQDEVAKWFGGATNAMKAFSSNGVSMKNENNDKVNNPTHYTAGGIETLDYIKAKVSDYPSYAVGNIVKYVSRYEHKNGIEDLKKAQFYLNDLIEWMESE
ncbi:DUF3310 domain-containing protein [Listeria monocytogenes]|nr:DUF3310 domain-containing protein [Listeria monocytogenes]ECB9600872.1 DUF3310 domain-containing protein [Listeria monocytogenes]ECC1707923.1 DUF3310 domain-containing protein [Listeria monocytogenes]EGP7076195.1 DUF3310 domain-containing protein [Listeria monocytogenes]EGP7268685.1 DUF3310 domain-containing protein [Listeria monocytogenes]